jgi:hypothetical protein
MVVTLLFFGPRTAIVLWWLTASDHWNRVFDSFLVALAGFLLLPWTMLAYVAVESSGVDGLDWLWILLAFLLDLASLAGGAVYRRGEAMS